MANKKNWDNIQSELTKDMGVIESVFKTTQETKAEQPKAAPESKTKRAYTHYVFRDKKTHTVTMRLTDKEYKDLLKKAEKSESPTISDYLLKLIKRG